MIIPNKNISKLDLSNKNLGTIPKEIFDLKNLRKLNLSGNNIKTIPKEIEKLQLLENLDISNNRISDFYAKVCQLSSLKKLNLNNNSIRRIPKQIGNLRRLNTLSIANNRIHKLPNEISALEKLTKLNIAKNPIEAFPQEILKIKTLKQIWLNNLDFKDFPIQDILKNLNSLNSIYFYGQLESRNSIDKNYKYLSTIKGNAMASLLRLKSQKERVEIKNNDSKKLETRKQNKIFISYSHQDPQWLKKVLTNLKVLQFDLNEPFEIWEDTRIKSGEKWKEEIKNALDDCSIAILIISTDFLASEFIQNNELPVLLENAQKKGTKIIPLIVGHCRFTKNKNLSQFQAVNDPTKPLNSLTNTEVEKILVNLTDDIESYL